MRKGFIKFRVSRVIPTFHSCRSKDQSTLPINPDPLFLHHSSTSTSTSHTLNLTPPSHSKPHHRFSLKRHVSSAFSSARLGCLRSRPSPETSHTESSSPSKPKNLIAKSNTPLYLNYDSTPPRRKIYNSAASDTEHVNDVVFFPPLLTKTRSRKIRRRRRTFSKVRISTSSDSGLFSEDDEDQERETLVSTDSPSPRSHHRHVIKSKKKKNRLSFDSPTPGNSSPAPARLSEFMRRMTPCRDVVEGKVRESFAVVKKSEDPYEDFKRSMVEMVVEKKMFEERELEELLRCFLSLNSQHHHEAIVQAFIEIWKGLFSHSPSSPE